jgi:hypothetical protein
MTSKAFAAPGKSLLAPQDHTLIPIDFQSQMAFAKKSIDPVILRNKAALVANAARIFNVSIIHTTVAEKTFSGAMFDEIKAALLNVKFFDVLAGRRTSVCIVGPRWTGGLRSMSLPTPVATSLRKFTSAP